MMIIVAVALAIAFAAAYWIVSVYHTHGGEYEAIAIMPQTNITLYINASGKVVSAKLYLSMWNRGDAEAYVYKVEMLSGEEVIQALGSEELRAQLQSIGKNEPVLPAGAKEVWPLSLDPTRFSKYVGSTEAASVKPHFAVKVYTTRGYVYPGIATIVVKTS